MNTRRALVCAPSMPEFDRQGGSKRIYNLIEFLLDAGWAVSFAAQNGNSVERYARTLQQRGVATYVGFNSRVDQLIAAGRFDLAFFAFWNIAELFIPKFRRLSPATRLIVDTIDLHFLRNARRIFRKSAGERPAARLDPDYGSEMIREMNAYAAADGVLAVSQKEADLINDLVGDSGLAFCVPESEDLPASVFPFAARQGIVFVGNFQHLPNREAFDYLCKEILPSLDPMILAKHPVYIVGNALDELVRLHGSMFAHVRLVGWVPSVLPYLEHARVSVIPLLHGAGTKTKLIQALMVGTPCVSTSIGTEGLNLQTGEHVLVADDPFKFATSIARLIEDEALWYHLASQGQAYIAALHGRETVHRQFWDVIAAVLAKSPKSLEHSSN